MRQELLTILFIRSSYKIRKLHLPFIYYKLLKYFIILFVLAFLGLVAAVVVLKQQNSELQQKLIRTEKQYKVLNSEPLEYKGKNAVPKTIPTDSAKKEVTVPSFTLVDSNRIAIQELLFKSVSENKYNVSFKLANQTLSTLQGYLVVGVFSEAIQAENGVYYPATVQMDPQFNIKNISQGESFSIRYFKNVNITLSAPKVLQPKNIIITVYLKNGNIIYRKAERINEN